jgi:hypothetical protein
VRGTLPGPPIREIAPIYKPHPRQPSIVSVRSAPRSRMRIFHMNNCSASGYFGRKPTSKSTPMIDAKQCATRQVRPGRWKERGVPVCF